MLSCLHEAPDGVDVDILVQPRASRTTLAGELDSRMKIRLAAPPVDGAANDALQDFLSKLLDVPRRSVELLSGQTGRRKRVRIRGVTMSQAEAALQSKDG